MGSFEVSKTRSCNIFAAADMMSPGSMLKAMPGDIPPAKPTAMVKPFKQKVLLVKNKPNKVVAKGVEAPNDLSRHKGKAPDKEGKIVSRAFTTKIRKKLAKTGAAEPDGSYPIKNAKDLANARKDLARTGNKPSDAAHVNKRAKALGLAAGGPGSGRKATMSIANKHGYVARHRQLIGKDITPMIKTRTVPGTGLMFEEVGNVKVGGDGSWEHSSGVKGANAAALRKHLGGLVGK